MSSSRDEALVRAYEQGIEAGRRAAMHEAAPMSGGNDDAAMTTVHASAALCQLAGLHPISVCGLTARDAAPSPAAVRELTRLAYQGPAQIAREDAAVSAAASWSEAATESLRRVLNDRHGGLVEALDRLAAAHGPRP